MDRRPEVIERADVGDDDADRKREATLQARAAMSGITLQRLDDGRWHAGRWNLSRELADAEVDRWLARVTGLPHQRTHRGEPNDGLPTPPPR